MSATRRPSSRFTGPARSKPAAGAAANPRLHARHSCCERSAPGAVHFPSLSSRLLKATSAPMGLVVRTVPGLWPGSKGSQPQPKLQLPEIRARTAHNPASQAPRVCHCSMETETSAAASFPAAGERFSPGKRAKVSVFLLSRRNHATRRRNGTGNTASTPFTFLVVSRIGFSEISAQIVTLDLTWKV